MVQEAEKYRAEDESNRSPSPMRRDGCLSRRLTAWCRKQKNTGQKMSRTDRRLKPKTAWKIIASPCATRSRRRSSRTSSRMETRRRLRKQCRRHWIGSTRTSSLRTDEFEGKQKE